MADVDAELREVREAAFQRYRDGEKQYGRLDLLTDKRDFLVEAEKELLDAINYFTFEVVKLRRLRKILNQQAAEKAPQPGQEGTCTEK